LAELARDLKARGSTLLDKIDEILVAHGMSHQLQWSVTLAGVEGKARIASAMAALRKEPLASLGASPVVRRVDLLAHEPPADVLVFHAEDGGRLTARPSGTEPKIKFYVELVRPVKSRAEVAGARALLEAQCAKIKEAVNARLGFA
jgi:phosphomannomutase